MIEANVNRPPNGLNYHEPKDDLRPEYRLVTHLRVAWHRWREARLIKRYRAQVADINQYAEWAQGLDAQVLEQQLDMFQRSARRQRLLTHERTQLYQALAVLRELCVDELGERPYDVQLLCALAMVDGQLVQLAPGEGKTLSLALAAVLFAWQGKPCHVVTANEYLAQRDALLLQPLFQRCRLSSASLSSDADAQEEVQAYAADIVYGTSNQFLADYLKDRLANGDVTINRLALTVSYLQGKPQNALKTRGLYSVIIDEADSILIDDATTPLIISGPQPDPALQRGILAARDIVDHLVPGRHYHIDLLHRDVAYTAKGEQALDALVDQLPSFWQHPERRREILQQAIQARDVFLRDHHYVIDDEKVVIVDEKTGRLMAGRSWSNGLHQAVEARAGVPLTDPNRIMARMSFQNYFKLYHRIAGASGTLQNIETEIFFNYRIHTLRIPSRITPLRQVHPYRAFPSSEARWAAVIGEIKHYHQCGRPVLIGTRNIEDSERLVQALRDDGMACELLNAKNHATEADIIATSGASGAVTVATNMAGRGTDIKVSPAVQALGGLAVIMLEPHESARIDWQLFGRTGRQGNPGDVMPLAAADDELLRKHLPPWLRPLNRLVALGLTSNYLITRLIQYAQKRAERRAFSHRQRLNTFDRKTREMMSFVRRKS
ncbi:hypothetical protein ELY33_07320 [Vreelandella andesensis]|uniref:Protein translocase subunit SecA n=1 Tax=Vreelandella andesensis TaxID=447567 RepID=A0A3S0Y408_9GAMM|nr:hypothetical protein [Halomonas andesensis]RUR31861.1 hypothetical protein ELY33_07320 [Halomonas andesensis]